MFSAMPGFVSAVPMGLTATMASSRSHLSLAKGGNVRYASPIAAVLVLDLTSATVRTCKKT